MGDLILFSHAKRVVTRSAAAGQSAEILFFTGVRYYRLDEPGDVAGQKPLSVRRRSPDQRRAARRTRPERTREALG